MKLPSLDSLYSVVHALEMNKPLSCPSKSLAGSSYLSMISFQNFSLLVYCMPFIV